MHRRRFLTTSLTTIGLAPGSLALLRPAFAQPTGSRRLVSIQMPGAPPRWMFDFMPGAYDTSRLQVSNNLSIATHYASSGGRYVRGEYSTVSVKGINAPPFWQNLVPSSGGGLRPVSALLDNFLSLQGVNAGVDGHETCQRLHWQPVAGQQSRAAMAADASQAPLSAVNVQAATFAFKSDRDKSFVPLTIEEETNPLTTLLRPFLSNYPEVSSSAQAAMAAAERQIDAANVRSREALSEVIASQTSAFTLLARNFGDLNAIFNQRRAVYQDLIFRSLSDNLVLPGINDLPIGNVGSRDGRYTLGGEEGAPIMTSDLRQIVTAQSYIPKLAEQMVLIEYILKEDLSRSIALGTEPILNLGGEGNPYGEQVFDEHGTGVMPSVLLNVKYFTALSACLLELIDQLKQANIFDDTIIELGGEFGRNALPSGFGSDHGWSGKNLSYFSGRLQGPNVIGNVYATPPADSGMLAYPGTWGYGAPVTGQGVLSMNHETATLATMLGVPSPTNAVPSLVQVNAQGHIVPVIEPARVV